MPPGIRSLFNLLYSLFAGEFSSVIDTRYSSSSSISSIQIFGEIFIGLALGQFSESIPSVGSLQSCSTFYITHIPSDHFQVFLENHQVLGEQDFWVDFELFTAELTDLVRCGCYFVRNDYVKGLEQDVQETLLFELLDDKRKRGKHPGVLSQATQQRVWRRFLEHFEWFKEGHAEFIIIVGG